MKPERRRRELDSSRKESQFRHQFSSLKGGLLGRFSFGGENA